MQFFIEELAGERICDQKAPFKNRVGKTPMAIKQQKPGGLSGIFVKRFFADDLHVYKYPFLLEEKANRCRKSSCGYSPGGRSRGDGLTVAAQNGIIF
jgi:hypothetical protein